MTFRDSVVNWLDPAFVREEELAAVLERKTSSTGAELERRNINMGQIAGNGWIEVTIPSSYEWFIYSVMGTEPTDGGAGSLPKNEFLQVYDDQGNIIFSIPVDTIPAVHAYSYLNWGIDLAVSTESDGGLPPRWFITAPLPKMWMKENYRIRVNREGVGGPPVTTSTYRMLYLEYRKVN